MKSFRLFAVIVTLLALFAACESVNIFLPESVVRKRLQGNWEMMRIAKRDVKQIWNFSDGVLTKTVYDSANTSLVTDVQTGTYEVSTTTSAGYIDIPDAGFTNSGAGVVAGRWLIDDITTSQLNMQHTEIGTNAIYYREFIKK
jgi:hypothetical protein